MDRKSTGTPLRKSIGVYPNFQSQASTVNSFLLRPLVLFNFTNKSTHPVPQVRPQSPASSLFFTARLRSPSTSSHPLISFTAISTSTRCLGLQKKKWSRMTEWLLSDIIDDFEHTVEGAEAEVVRSSKVAGVECSTADRDEGIELDWRMLLPCMPKAASAGRCGGREEGTRGRNAPSSKRSLCFVSAPALNLGDKNQPKLCQLRKLSLEKFTIQQWV